ncbi:MAG: DUF115 domain-containing protein [Spirochaetaceae bacterium]|jgi:hypothetical protein|nr:DUF115 domain-containing protein [Spirochaetaceae bacterium]
MDKQFLFERNLLALSRTDSALCARLCAAETTLGRYRFVESKNGALLPAWVDGTGAAHTLHSLAAPEKEARRLLDTAGDEGFIVLLGLGGGFYAEAALERGETARVLVIDFDINGVAELLCHHQYIKIFNDSRFSILVDPDENDLRGALLALYQPALHGGLKTFPLRARTDFDAAHFAPAAATLKKTLESIAEDYSVQSCFGRRWYANIIRNCLLSEEQHHILPPVASAAVCAAGPSLDKQMPVIKSERANYFLIATDTSLPALLHAGIRPDAIISIDCQHISYVHFAGCNVEDIPVFLDLASPPLIAGRSKKIFFFSGGHPLTNYISAKYRTFPVLDTSGANVTYAGVTLAEKLGARRITVFGADFSYPKGAAYAKAAYFYPFFHRRQNRLAPAFSMLNAFIYKSPSLRRIENEYTWYYETKPMLRYRQRLEEKSRSMEALLIAAPGGGAPIHCGRSAGGDVPGARALRPLPVFASGRAQTSAKTFLSGYRSAVLALPPFGENVTTYIEKLNTEERQVFVTLLPAAAAIRSRNNTPTPTALLDEAKHFCASKIEQLLKVR